MHVSITGVSGFIGAAMARHFHAAGHRVTGLVRSTSNRDAVAPFVDRFVVGEQHDENVWPALLEGSDGIVHNSFDFNVVQDPTRNLASNLVGAIRLLNASSPRRFVYISTIAVHYDMRARWEGVIDEDHPLRPGSNYGAAKAAVEAHLWAAHHAETREVVAIRPCGVYGVDRRIERSLGHSILRTVYRKHEFQQAGGGKFVHVDDVAQAAVAAMTRAEANGCAFNLVDCYARWSDWARWGAEVMGIDARIDDTSPPSPRNRFDVSAARALGVALDRGHEGIRSHLKLLKDQMDL